MTRVNQMYLSNLAPFRDPPFSTIVSFVMIQMFAKCPRFNVSIVFWQLCNTSSTKRCSKATCSTKDALSHMFHKDALSHMFLKRCSKATCSTKDALSHMFHKDALSHMFLKRCSKTTCSTKRCSKNHMFYQKDALKPHVPQKML